MKANQKVLEMMRREITEEGELAATVCAFLQMIADVSDPDLSVQEAKIVMDMVEPFATTAEDLI